VLAAVLLAALAVGACGGSTPTAATATGAAVSATTSPASTSPPATRPASPGPSAVATLPATSAQPTEDPAAPAAAALASRSWATAELVDVQTDQPFRIADFAGRTVFVESMAIWCTNCRQQQARFKEALAKIDPERVAYVVLTVEPSESAEELARYEAEREFTGTYAVAGRAVARALEEEFGPIALNPPAVPLVVVHPSGEIEFRTGGESVDDIVATVGG
jgi:thiol-disulfide isomerase/thioredoxin